MARRVLAKEGNDARTFEEFGTGEQQILPMAFAKAYMEVFGSESVVLMLSHRARPLLQGQARRAGFGRLAEVATRMCKLYLGLPEGGRSWCLDADEGLCKSLLLDAFESGNFLMR